MISRRAKRLTLGFVFVFGIVVLLVFSVQRYFANREAQRRYDEEQAQIKPRELYLVKAERRDGVRTRRYAARIAPWIEARISAEVAGKVQEVFVDPGSVVEKGAPLAQLDRRMAEIDLAAADAALRSAELQAEESERLLEEARTLSRKKVISTTETKARGASAEMNRATANRLAAERDRLAESLDRHTIRAPFAGTIRARLVDVGDYVAVGEPVVDLVQLDPLRVVFHVSEFEVGAFRVGEPVALKIAGMEDRTFQPVVTNASRSADPETSLFQIEAKLGNPDRTILGGTQGVVEAEVAVYANALFIPASAVRLSGKTALVEVPAENGGTRMQEIEIGQEVDGSYPVVSGLEEGDEVVVR